MDRRSFIERIAALIGVGIAAPTARAETAPPIELQRSPVAGFQYHQGAAVWPLLAVGATLDLVREPENAYDQRAVRIDWQGQKLGYVPRIDNAAVSHLLDNGQTLDATIVSLQASSDPWQRIAIAIRLEA
mgnify:CR=1 FL=1